MPNVFSTNLNYSTNYPQAQQVGGMQADFGFTNVNRDLHMQALIQEMRQPPTQQMPTQSQIPQNNEQMDEYMR
jgi:hypothetical protein